MINAACHCATINPRKEKQGKHVLPDCVVCSKRGIKRHQTQYVCKNCVVDGKPVPMCLFPFHRRYYYLLNYKIQCTPALHISEVGLPRWGV